MGVEILVPERADMPNKKLTAGQTATTQNPIRKEESAKASTANAPKSVQFMAYTSYLKNNDSELILDEEGKEILNSVSFNDGKTRFTIMTLQQERRSRSKEDGSIKTTPYYDVFKYTLNEDEEVIDSAKLMAYPSYLKNTDGDFIIDEDTEDTILNSISFPAGKYRYIIMNILQERRVRNKETGKLRTISYYDVYRYINEDNDSEDTSASTSTTVKDNAI